MSVASWEGGIESIQKTTESMDTPQMNVNYLKSVLQSIHLSADEVSHRCRDVQQGPSLQVPINYLLLNGLHVLQKMCTPSSISWPSSFTEMQDLLCDIVSHVSAEFIFELLTTCSPSDSSEHCNILNEVSLVLSSITSASNSASTVLPTRKSSPFHSHNAGLQEDDKLTDKDATTYSESEQKLIVCHDVKLEAIETSSDKKSGPLMRHHSYEFSKKIPASIALCRRGVRCKICFHLYKGPTCVDRLVEHTRAKHPDRASPKYLNQLRLNSSIQRIVGHGMRICRCQMCNLIGPGSLLT